jgi:hypothetical protein
MSMHTHRIPHAQTRSRAPGHRPRILLLGMAVTLIAAGLVTYLLTSGSGPSCQQSLVPAYFYPGSDWSQAIASRPPPGVMIVDITSSGAGIAPNRIYQVTLKHARAAGITLAGYVNTDYGHRPVTAVEADVRHYRSWYGVTSIFLDEVASGPSGLPYYRQLARYIHAAVPGSKVVLNPGTYPDEGYLSVGDIVMVYENTYADYLRLRVPGWVHKFPAGKFAYAVYGAGQDQLARVIALALSRHAGYVYVTSGSGTNPYGSLPSYWRAENTIIARCTVPAA